MMSVRSTDAVGTLPKPPVLLIGNFLSSAVRNECVCEELARRLSAAGWHVLTASGRSGRLARLCDMALTAWRLRRRYTVAGVDVFSGPAFLWAEVACWVLRRAAKRYVLILRGGKLPDFARHRSRRVRRLLSSAAAVVAPSRYLFEQMRPYCENLQLLDNPLDIRRCRFRQRQTAAPRLVWLRAFHRIYNPALAPQIVAALRPDFPGVRLTMWGPDKGDGSLQSAIRAAAGSGVADCVHFPGKAAKSEVPEILDQGDIFLNTTDVDNTPVSVLEAMACGLCVVSTNVGGIPYMLEHERDALLVPPRDPAAAAAAVRRILTEPGLSRRLSENARRKVERFDWSVILPQWETLLASLVEAPVGARR